MKKIMTMMLAVVTFGMFAQNSQDVYALTDDVFNMSYADLGNSFTEEKTEAKAAEVLEANDVYVSDSEMLEVDDLLLADPDFDIQEDMISYTKDQKTVYFSANKKLKANKKNETALKIKKSVQLQMFKASVTETGEWVNLEMLPINGKNHSTGYPALNGDDTKLYFVSDGPESTGKTDLFMVDLLENGTYGKPENLGSKINTAERELSPFVDDSNVLYFASDIQTAGEELNVFAAKVIDNEPSTPIKLDVQATASKQDYVAAYKSVDVEALLAEKAATLKDMEILLEAENLSEIERIKEVYGAEMTGAAYDFDQNDIMYTVQIGAFQENVKTGTYTDSAGLFNHRYEDGFNRFYSGVFKSQKEALSHLKKMKKDGYQDAFILGLKGNERFLLESSR
jgi:hypothetical protein